MSCGFSFRAAVLVGLAASLSLASPFQAHYPLRPRQTAGVPSVDLGYEVHTATVNETGEYYIFSNIPYSQQPVDDRRFQLPTLLSGNDSTDGSTVNNGSGTVICMQAYPEWIIETEAEAYGINTTTLQEILYYAAGQTEACLVLDVYVPESIFANNGSVAAAPVVIWIHGGGFADGSKNSAGDPAGILARSQLNDNEGVIFVSINYRLGLFGWLGGAPAEENLTDNLGFYDQRVAFDWVQKYISLFGGDPTQVTVIGESAGASSVLHHITSYGGNGTVPFSQAIIQSPAFQFNLNLTSAYDKTLAEASTYTNTSITTVADLAALDLATLQAINFNVVLAGTDGSFVYGPAPDGSYVPALPQVLLAEGRFHQDVKIMAGHNSLEAVPFVPSTISTEDDLVEALTVNFPEASNATLTYILDTLYPAANYSTEFLRGVQIITDSDFSCSTRYLGVAFGNETYNYIFAYPPGYHGQDIPYTFFNGDTSTLDDGSPVDADLAYALQDYIIGFAISGDPNASPVPSTANFPIYGDEADVLVLGSSGLSTGTDDMANERCVWWQHAMEQGLA